MIKLEAVDDVSTDDVLDEYLMNDRVKPSAAAADSVISTATNDISQ